MCKRHFWSASATIPRGAATAALLCLANPIYPGSLSTIQMGILYVEVCLSSVCCWCMYPRFLMLISIDICLPLTYKSLQVWVSLTSWPDLTRPDLCLWMLTAKNLFVLSQFTCTCFHTLGTGPCFYCANISRINIYTLPTSQKTYDVFDWSI